MEPPQAHARWTCVMDSPMNRSPLVLLVTCRGRLLLWVPFPACRFLPPSTMFTLVVDAIMHALRTLGLAPA